MVLTHTQAQKFYDRFGKKQDSQSFYEDSGLDDLVAHGNFEQAKNVFEFGCGTGRFAERLLREHLSSSASYLGLDISKTMIQIAEQRLTEYSTRASVIQSDGTIVFPLPDHSVDRVISTYVLDLLSETDIHNVIAETIRVLKPGGLICLLSLSNGVTLLSRMVVMLWTRLYHLHASLVGGCRPTQLQPLFAQGQWTIQYHNVVTSVGIPSEILIASPSVSIEQPDRYR